MRKILKITLAVLLGLAMLTGCGDASATLSDKKSALITVGKTSVTKEQVYDHMVTADAAKTVILQATASVLDAEVETTDAMKTAAQAKVDSYKKQFGDNFTTYLQYLGYSTEQDLYDASLNDERASALIDKYITDNWDSLVTKYTPIMAKLMYFEASSYSSTEAAYQAAGKALDEVKAGADFATTAAKYKSSSTLAAEQLYTRETESLDYNVLQFMTTATTPTLSTVIANEAVDGYYIVQITSVNIEQYKSNFVSYLKGLTDMSNTVNAFYFTKHNFTIYDITTYNLVKSNYAAYLVQKTGPKTTSTSSN